MLLVNAPHNRGFSYVLRLNIAILSPLNTDLIPISYLCVFEDISRINQSTVNDTIVKRVICLAITRRYCCVTFCNNCQNCIKCRLRWLNTVLRAVSGSACLNQTNKHGGELENNGTEKTISQNLLIKILRYLTENENFKMEVKQTNFVTHLIIAVQ